MTFFFTSIWPFLFTPIRFFPMQFYTQIDLFDRNVTFSVLPQYDLFFSSPTWPFFNPVWPFLFTPTRLFIFLIMTIFYLQYDIFFNRNITFFFYFQRDFFFTPIWPFSLNITFSFHPNMTFLIQLTFLTVKAPFLKLNLTLVFIWTFFLLTLTFFFILSTLCVPQYGGVFLHIYFFLLEGHIFIIHDNLFAIWIWSFQHDYIFRLFYNLNWRIHLYLLNLLKLNVTIFLYHDLVFHLNITCLLTWSFLTL